jgi:dolichol-phosphate mannosyltransferase
MAKLKLREMGSRYLFIIAYVWLEKALSHGDYVRASEAELEQQEAQSAINGAGAAVLGQG